MNLSSFPLIHPSIWKVKHRNFMRINRKVYVTIILHLFPFFLTPEFQQHWIFSLTCTFCILIARFYFYETQATLPRGRGVSYLLKWILDSLSWKEKSILSTTAIVKRKIAFVGRLADFWCHSPIQISPEKTPSFAFWLVFEVLHQQVLCIAELVYDSLNHLK